MAYQQQGRVDVDVLEDDELLLNFDGKHPRSLELRLHPVPHAAVFALERRRQRPEHAHKRTVKCQMST